MARVSPYTVGGRRAVAITTDSINAIEDWIRWAEITGDPARFLFWMDTLVHHMALINQGYAQRMSAGPYDPYQQNRNAAWKIPVRRISEKYYLGWKVRRVGPGIWMLFNDSREAFFIEFGINWRGDGARVRRPIRKLTQIQTLQAMMRTHAYHRVWASIYKDPRKSRGRGFTQVVQSPGMGSFTGPLLGRRLP